MKRKYAWPFVVICGITLIALVAVGDNALWGQRTNVPAIALGDPDLYEFQLMLPGQPAETYTACSGLGSSNEIEEITTWTDAGLVVAQKTPGALQWHSIQLKREGPTSMSVWLWRKAMEDGDLNNAIRDGEIIMTRPGSSEPLARWHFRSGWAARLVFDGATEELTVVHEGLEYWRQGESEPSPMPRRR